MKSRTEDPKLLGAVFRNIIARDAQRRFVVPCTIMMTARSFTLISIFWPNKGKIY
jgi:hypothetical protein